MKQERSLNEAIGSLNTFLEEAMQCQEYLASNLINIASTDCQKKMAKWRNRYATAFDLKTNEMKKQYSIGLHVECVESDEIRPVIENSISIKCDTHAM